MGHTPQAHNCDWLDFRIVALAVLAVIVRLIPLLRESMNFAVLPGDSDQYLQLSAGLRHGCGFARLYDGTCQLAEILRTPGYPLLLAVLPGISWTLAVQSVMNGALCVLLGVWVKRRWSLAAALVAEAIVALDLPSLTGANLVMSDALFQFVLTLAVMPTLMLATDSQQSSSWLRAILAAIAAAFAILTRPIALFLPVVMALPFLFRIQLRRQRFALAALCFLLPTAMMIGWIVRNYRTAGYFGLSTVSAINLYFYRAANVLARITDVPFDRAQQTLGTKLGLTLPQVFSAQVQSQELARRMTEMGRSIVLAHPREAFLMTVESTIYISITPDRSSLARVLGLTGGYPRLQVGLAAGTLSLRRLGLEIHRAMQSPVLDLLLIFQIVLVAIMWFGVICALLWLPRASTIYRTWVLYLTAVAMLFIVLAAGGEASVRFRMPVVPLLATVAAIGYFPQVGEQKND